MELTDRQIRGTIAIVNDHRDAMVTRTDENVSRNPGYVYDNIAYQGHHTECTDNASNIIVITEDEPSDNYERISTSGGSTIQPEKDRATGNGEGNRQIMGTSEGEDTEYSNPVDVGWSWMVLLGKCLLGVLWSIDSHSDLEPHCGLCAKLCMCRHVLRVIWARWLD